MHAFESGRRRWTVGLMVFAFLVKPIKMDDLQPAIWMTMSRYAEVNSLRSRLAAAAANHSDGSLKEIRPSTEN